MSRTPARATHALLLALVLLTAPASVPAEEIPEYMRQVIVTLPTPSPAEVAAQNAIALDDQMLGIYDDALRVYRENLLASSPVILGLFSNTGGEFHLYRPGQPRLQAPPVPISYQIVKGTAHSAMAVYQLVARYIGNPADPSWLAPMAEYRAAQNALLDRADDLELPAAPRAAVKTLLTHNIAFMDESLRKGTFTMAQLASFAASQREAIQTAVGFAAEVQVSHWMNVLAGWKALLGPDFDRAYGVTNTLYVTRTNNIMFTMMAQFFGKMAINDRLLLLETTEFTTTPDTMLGLLARIVADRALGKLFFKDYFLMDVELVSTGSRDAIAEDLARRIPASGGAYMVFSGRRKIEEEARRLGITPMLPPLAPFHSQEWPWRTRASEGEGPETMKEALGAGGGGKTDPD